MKDPAMFEPYTERAWRAIFFARYEAGQYGSSHVASEHVLLGLLSQDKALLEMFAGQENLFRQIRAEIEQHCGPYKWLSEFRAEIEQHGSSYDASEINAVMEQHFTRRKQLSANLPELPPTDEVTEILRLAAEESDRIGHRLIGTEHLLLGILRAEESLAARLLRARGLKVEEVRERLANGRPPEPARPKRLLLPAPEAPPDCAPWRPPATVPYVPPTDAWLIPAKRDYGADESAPKVARVLEILRKNERGEMTVPEHKEFLLLTSELTQAWEAVHGHTMYIYGRHVTVRGIPDKVSTREELIAHYDLMFEQAAEDQKAIERGEGRWF
jgi:hypothetical protein